MENNYKAKVGDCVTFRGKSVVIYGFVARINGDDVDYIRDSLTRWSASKVLVERGETITKDNFISRVKLNAENSSYPIPSTEQIEMVLEKFKDNFDCEQSEILEILYPTSKKEVSEDVVDFIKWYRRYGYLGGYSTNDQLAINYKTYLNRKDKKNKRK